MFLFLLGVRWETCALGMPPCGRVWRPWFCVLCSVKREHTWCEEKDNQEKSNEEKKNQEKDKYDIILFLFVFILLRVRWEYVCVRYAALRAGLATHAIIQIIYTSTIHGVNLEQPFQGMVRRTCSKLNSKPKYQEKINLHFFLMRR